MTRCHENGMNLLIENNGLIVYTNIEKNYKFQVMMGFYICEQYARHSDDIVRPTMGE